jgi:hypothetical protein
LRQINDEQNAGLKNLVRVWMWMWVWVWLCARAFYLPHSASNRYSLVYDHLRSLAPTIPKNKTPVDHP